MADEPASEADGVISWPVVLENDPSVELTKEAEKRWAIPPTRATLQPSQTGRRRLTLCFENDFFQANWLALPEDCLELIFSFLQSFDDAFSLSQTCRRLRRAFLQTYAPARADFLLATLPHRLWTQPRVPRPWWLAQATLSEISATSGLAEAEASCLVDAVAAQFATEPALFAPDAFSPAGHFEALRLDQGCENHDACVLASAATPCGSAVVLLCERRRGPADDGEHAVNTGVGSLPPTGMLGLQPRPRVNARPGMCPCERAGPSARWLTWAKLGPPSKSGPRPNRAEVGHSNVLPVLSRVNSWDLSMCLSPSGDAIALVGAQLGQSAAKRGEGRGAARDPALVAAAAAAEAAAAAVGVTLPSAGEPSLVDLPEPPTPPPPRAGGPGPAAEGQWGQPGEGSRQLLLFAAGLRGLVGRSEGLGRGGTGPRDLKFLLCRPPLPRGAAVRAACFADSSDRRLALLCTDGAVRVFDVLTRLSNVFGEVVDGEPSLVFQASIVPRGPPAPPAADRAPSPPPPPGDARRRERVRAAPGTGAADGRRLRRRYGPLPQPPGEPGDESEEPDPFIEEEEEEPEGGPEGDPDAEGGPGAGRGGHPKPAPPDPDAHLYPLRRARSDHCALAAAADGSTLVAMWPDAPLYPPPPKARRERGARRHPSALVQHLSLPPLPGPPLLAPASSSSSSSSSPPPEPPTMHTYGPHGFPHPLAGPPPPADGPQEPLRVQVGVVVRTLRRRACWTAGRPQRRPSRAGAIPESIARVLRSSLSVRLFGLAGQTLPGNPLLPCWYSVTPLAVNVLEAGDPTRYARSFVSLFVRRSPPSPRPGAIGAGEEGEGGYSEAVACGADCQLAHAHALLAALA